MSYDQIIRRRRAFAFMRAAVAFGLGPAYYIAATEPTGGATGRKEMREEFSRLHGEAKAVIDAAAAEKRDLKPEERTANEQRFARLTAIKGVMDDDAKFAALAIAGEPEPTGKVQLPGEPPGAADGRTEFSGDSDAAKSNRMEIGRAFTRWALSGEMDRKFATITTATNSGILLPKTIAPPLALGSSNAFREAHDILGVMPVETAGTADLTIPVLDASAGGVVAENASSETENAPSTTESIRLTPKTYQSGSVWFSNQQLAANDFDLLATVVPQLTYSKELGLEAAMAAALIADAAITQQVATATTTGFTYANLVDLDNALPKRYQKQKAIVLGKDAYAAATKLVGSDGHPVLIADVQNTRLLRFLGTPVLRSDYLEAFGASKIVGTAFSLLGFRIRDVTVQNLARYVNIPSRPNQTGLNLFAYHGFGWAPSAVATLKTPAS